MRTTLDIADDVLAAARDRSRHEKKTIGEIISDLARHALISAAPAAAVHEPATVYDLTPFPSRGGLVTNDMIQRIREDDAY